MACRCGARTSLGAAQQPDVTYSRRPPGSRGSIRNTWNPLVNGAVDAGQPVDDLPQEVPLRVRAEGRPGDEQGSGRHAPIVAAARAVGGGSRARSGSGTPLTARPRAVPAPRAPGSAATRSAPGPAGPEPREATGPRGRM